MHKLLLAFAVLALTMGAGTVASPTSSALGDRLDRAEARIAAEAGTRLVSSEQAELFRADIVAIRSASASDPARAARMLDVFDRELARNDLQLAMPEDNYHVLVHVGYSIVVAMHDEREWTVRSSDAIVLAPRMGIMYMRGVQGIFSAKRPGAAVLTVASAATRQGTGTPQPAVHFVRFHIIVIAATPPPERGKIL